MATIFYIQILFVKVMKYAGIYNAMCSFFLHVGQFSIYTFLTSKKTFIIHSFEKVHPKTKQFKI